MAACVKTLWAFVVVVLHYCRLRQPPHSPLLPVW
jgi:hypothetical protein